MMEYIQSNVYKKHKCGLCEYSSNRSTNVVRHRNKMHVEKVSIINMPPEILNIICTNLFWRDIKSLEEVLPSDIYQKSGVKREVIRRTIPLLNDYRRYIYSNKKENKKEVRFLSRSYYYQLTLYPYINFYTLHALLDSHYERIIMCNNLVQGDNAMILNLRQLYHEIFLWCNK